MSFFLRTALLLGAPAALAVAWPGATLAAEPAAEADGGSDIPMVLTPTRLRQSLVDVPGSVTIITADMLKKFGVRTIPDALRLVPGMAVTRVTGSDYRINYHGTNILVPRRMNVLVDGISVYGLRIALVDWNALPVVIEDIEKIEVIRGPNSASYGANSMLAIVNIITKHPSEADGAVLRANGGTMQKAGGMARYGGKLGERTAYRVTAERLGDKGFDYASTMHAGHDTSRLARLNLRALTTLSHDETVDLQASVVQGVNQMEYVDGSQISFPDIHVRDYSVSATWKNNLTERHAVQVQAYVTKQSRGQAWRSCVPSVALLPELYRLSRANPVYANQVLAGRTAPSGNAAEDLLAAAARAAIRALGAQARQKICVDSNQDLSEIRSDVEFQDIAIFSGALRMVNGVGVRRDNAVSETYLAGNVDNTTWRAFSNVEYKPAAALNVNAGGFLEKNALTGFAFSPRIALNAHLDAHSTMRFVLSRAVRMPDMLEQRADWSYPASNLSTPLNGAATARFYRNAISPANLTGEKIVSKEIGYLGNFPHYGVLLDAKLFDDKLTDLISEKLQSASFLPTNDNSARLSGVEMQLNYVPADNWSMFAAYSYLNNHASTVYERTQYARHSGAVGLAHTMRGGWRYALAYYGYGERTQGQTPYGRTDLVLSKSFRMEKDTSVTPSFSVSRLSHRNAAYFDDIGKIRESRYNDSMQYVFSLTIGF